MNEVANAIYDKLATNTSLVAQVGTRIYRGVAPQSAIYPLVIITLMGGGVTTETPTDMADPFYLVSVISDVSTAQAGTIAEYIKTALHRQTLTVSGWSNYWTGIGNHYEAVELPSVTGKPLWQSGWFVRINLSK